jgi:hypothetical protein
MGAGVLLDKPGGVAMKKKVVVVWNLGVYYAHSTTPESDLLCVGLHPVLYYCRISSSGLHPLHSSFVHWISST